MQWNSAVDPDLPDGTAGSGVIGYQVRYQSLGTAWSAWQPTTYPQLLLPGGVVGQPLAVEVTASDNAGNVSASVDWQTVRTPFVPGESSNIACQPTDFGYTPECGQAIAAATGGTQNEYDPGPPVSLTPLAVLSGLGPSPLGTYEISVINNGWGTIRNAAQQFVTGSVHNGSLMTLTGTPSVGLSSRGQHVFWSPGLIQGALLDTYCGWVEATNLETSIGGATLGSCGRTTFDQASFMSTRNAKLNDGTRITTTAGSEIYLNTFPFPPVRLPVGTRRVGVDTMGYLPAGSTVNWRYVTTDGSFLMVRHGRRTDGHPNWIFIKRSSIRGLCSRTTCTAPAG